MASSFIERQIKRGGILTALGLVVQLVTLFWVHPLAFVAFLAVGCPLVAIGVILYLYSLVSPKTLGLASGAQSTKQDKP